MPAPNDMTKEEEALFANHGVAPAGPGREPVGDEGQQPPPDDEGQQPPPDDEGQQGQHADRPRRPDGTFMSREEIAAQQGQQQGEEGGEEGGGEQKPRMVPHEALHAERLRAAEATRLARTATTRLNALLQRQQGSEQAPEMPDVNEDPAGYLQALEQRLATFEQGMQQQREEQQIDNALTNDEDLFALSQPDYHIASDHYVRSRAAELLQFHTPEQAQAMMFREARQIAKESWQRGLSPAETIYNLARARGYVPGQGGQQQQQGGQRQQQGGQRQGGPTAQEQLVAMRAGKQASRSLSGGAGAGTKTLNAEALLQMSDEEFDEYLGLGKKGANERFAAVG